MPPYLRAAPIGASAPRPGLLTWCEIWCDVENSKSFRSSCDCHTFPGHRLKGASALHNFLASIFTAPSVTTWSDMSGNTRKNQVTRLETLRHRSIMSGALETASRYGGYRTRELPLRRIRRAARPRPWRCCLIATCISGRSGGGGTAPPPVWNGLMGRTITSGQLDDQVAVRASRRLYRPLSLTPQHSV